MCLTSHWAIIFSIKVSPLIQTIPINETKERIIDNTVESWTLVMVYEVKYFIYFLKEAKKTPTFLNSFKIQL
jgi:hypothetical protein